MTLKEKISSNTRYPSLSFKRSQLEPATLLKMIFFASNFAELLVNSNKHLLYEKKFNELLQLFKTRART